MDRKGMKVAAKKAPEKTLLDDSRHLSVRFGVRCCVRIIDALGQYIACRSFERQAISCRCLLRDYLRRCISCRVSMILLYLMESVKRRRGNALIIRRCCLFRIDAALACILARISCEESDQS